MLYLLHLRFVGAWQMLCQILVCKIHAHQLLVFKRSLLGIREMGRRSLNSVAFSVIFDLICFCERRV